MDLRKTAIFAFCRIKRFVFFKQAGECLLRGTNRVFKQNILGLCPKWLRYLTICRTIICEHFNIKLSIISTYLFRISYIAMDSYYRLFQVKQQAAVGQVGRP